MYITYVYLFIFFFFLNFNVYNRILQMIGFQSELSHACCLSFNDAAARIEWHSAGSQRKKSHICPTSRPTCRRMKGVCRAGGWLDQRERPDVGVLPNYWNIFHVKILLMAADDQKLYSAGEYHSAERSFRNASYQSKAFHEKASPVLCNAS